MAEEERAWWDLDDSILAPNYKLVIAGQELPEEITKYVTSVEYESADLLMDTMKVQMMNPDYRFSELKLFLPGNEMELWGGYGVNLSFIGRAVISKHRATYPPGGMPSISITGYTGDWFMSQKKPDIENEGKGEDSITYNNVKITDVIAKIAEFYSMEKDIDPSDEKITGIYQIKDVTHFQFCRGLANTLGWYFWVDGSEDGKWILHFRDPKLYDSKQEIMYTFNYNNGDLTTLFSFEPEMILSDFFTKVTAEITLSSGQVVKKTFIHEKESWDLKPTNAIEEVEEEISSALDVKLYFKDFSVAIPNTEAIKNPADLERFVDRWIERHKNEFVIAKGNTVGIENIFARQRHKISNVGTLYDGEWYFNKVRHVFSSNNGYNCNFDARKIDP